MIHQTYSNGNVNTGDHVFYGEKRSGHFIILCRKKDGNRQVILD